MTLYTLEDIEDAARDLATLLAQHEAEPDPAWRAALADMIQSDTAFLAEMREAVMPPLPLVLPLGVPAPRAGWGVVL
jgi:hypothetical protein